MSSLMLGVCPYTNSIAPKVESIVIIAKTSEYRADFYIINGIYISLVPI